MQAGRGGADRQPLIGSQKLQAAIRDAYLLPKKYFHSVLLLFGDQIEKAVDLFTILVCVAFEAGHQGHYSSVITNYHTHIPARC